MKKTLKNSSEDKSSPKISARNFSAPKEAKFVRGRGEVEQIISNINGNFNKVGRLWIRICLDLHTIKQGNLFLRLGYDSFNQMCQEQLPNISATTITKFSKVAAAFHPQLLEASKSHRSGLSYDLLYQLYRHGEEFQEQESMKLVATRYVKGEVTITDVQRLFIEKVDTKAIEESDDGILPEEIGHDTSKVDTELLDDGDDGLKDEERILSSIAREALSLIERLTSKLVQAREHWIYAKAVEKDVNALVGAVPNLVKVLTEFARGCGEIIEAKASKRQSADSLRN